MKKCLFFLIIIILAVLETALLNSFGIFTVRPDLLLLCVALAAFNFDLNWVLIFSVFIGVLKDALTVNSFAVYTLLFPLWGFLIVKASRKLSLEDNYLRFALILILVVLNDIILRLIFFLSGRYIPFGAFLGITLIEFLYTALILPLLFKIFKPLGYL